MNDSIEHKNKTYRRIAAYKGYKNGFAEFYGNQIEVITGYTKEEFKTIRWTDLILEEDKKSAKEAFVKALKTDKVYTREYRIRAKDGSIVWLQEFSEIVLDQNGEIDCVVGALMDVTEEKKIEEIIKRHERLTGKYLIFRSSDITYGLSIDRVKEVITPIPATPVPETSDFMEGVINLRGKVIPVMNLRKFFGQEGEIASDQACIIIVEIPFNGEHLLLGIHVDNVTGVIHIRGEDIDDIPQALQRHNIEYAIGIAKTDQGLVIILSMERLCRSSKLSFLRASASSD
ncbi:MAG: chemotaxis protein CheW [Thermodesulforhabdaceae bacterium]